MSDPSKRLLELLIDEAGIRAEEALERGVLSSLPDRIVAYVSVADCTSRLLPTVRSRLYDKVRRVASAVRRSADATASRLSFPPPVVELRLRHSALLLAGHPPGSWSVLVHALNDAARDAGIERVTGPLVTWNLLDICGRLEQVLPAADRVVFRADVGTQPDPDEIRGLAVTVPLSGPCTAVVSAGASTCPLVHPDLVEIRAVGCVPASLAPDPVLFRTSSAVLARQSVLFVQELTAGQPAWRAGLPGIEINDNPLSRTAMLRDVSWLSAGWPLSRHGSNRLQLDPSCDPDATARQLADRLMPLSIGEGTETTASRHVVIEVP